ncbi:MAG: hypothetical protein WC184_05795 [Acidimicrobiia bacterium]
MKRRTLDLFFSIGGVGIALLLLVLAIVFKQEGDFADNYVREQFAQQQIYFTPADSLTEEEAKFDCLVKYGQGDEAARLLDTGKKAECYANHYIGLHVEQIGGGLTYAQLGGPENEVKAKIAEAEDEGKDTTELQAELKKVQGQRETVFKGETLRGVLLTAYGFSVLGTKAALAATVAFVGAALMALLSIAGFIHYAKTPESELID